MLRQEMTYGMETPCDICPAYEKNAYLIIVYDLRESDFFNHDNEA